MLKLNVLPLLQSKGIAKPQQYLTNAGMTHYTVSRLINNCSTTIGYDTLEKLCLLCQCTPNDLFVWVPDPATPDTADTPLHQLKQKPKLPNPVDRIQQLPLDKLQQLQAFIDKLEKGE